MLGGGPGALGAGGGTAGHRGAGRTPARTPHLALGEAVHEQPAVPPAGSSVLPGLHVLLSLGVGGGQIGDR